MGGGGGALGQPLRVHGAARAQGDRRSGVTETSRLADGAEQRIETNFDSLFHIPYFSPFDFAVIHAGLGYHRRALAELEQAYKERSLSAQSLRFDPRLNDLRGDRDYQGFAKRLGVD